LKEDVFVIIGIACCHFPISNNSKATRKLYSSRLF